MNEKSRNTLAKIIHHSVKSIEYTKLQGAWWEDDRTLEAIVFNLAQIGELVRFVEESVQQENEYINWAAMKGLRNRIVHDYDYINPLVIRGIVEKDLPQLIIDLTSCL